MRFKKVTWNFLQSYVIWKVFVCAQRGEQRSLTLICSMSSVYRFFVSKKVAVTSVTSRNPEVLVLHPKQVATAVTYVVSSQRSHRLITGDCNGTSGEVARGRVPARKHCT